MPRMNILNTVEQEAFESAPVFNSFQRKQYFDFPQAVQQAAANLRTPANQLWFLLACGYFKASKGFFLARTFHPRDVEYVAGRTGLRLEEIELYLYPVPPDQKKVQVRCPKPHPSSHFTEQRPET